MKKILILEFRLRYLIGILILLTTLLQISCAEKNGYYNEGESSIIDLVCDITWISKKTVNDEGVTYQGIYNFKEDGTYARTLIATDKDGKEQQSAINGQWSFGDPSFSTIYFGRSLYWDIDELTEKKFAVYERNGNWGDPGVVRTYLEFTPQEQPQTTH